MFHVAKITVWSSDAAASASAALHQITQYRNGALRGKPEYCKQAGKHRGDFSGGMFSHAKE